MAITTLNKRYTIHILQYYCYIDLDSSSTAPPSSYPPAEEEHPSLDPPVEDDDDEEEEPEVQPTAAEIVQAGVARGQLDPYI